MLKRTLKLAVLLLADFLSISAVTAQPGYRTYHNARFDYSISSPPNILIPQGESPNGDGQKFLSRDGRTEMLVFGSNNSLVQTLRQIYQHEISRTEHPDRTVTYQVLRTEWLAVSGVENSRVLYQKTMPRNGVFKTFRIEYNQSPKRTFDSITATIARSFRG